MLTIEPPSHNRRPLPPVHGDPAPAAGSPPPEPEQHGFTLHVPTSQPQTEAPQVATTPVGQSTTTNAAAELIRHKIERLYQSEPPAKKEITASEHAAGAPSKHQAFVMNLVNAGRPLAEIQDAWHAYYANLSDIDKHQVWHEFYASYERASKFAQSFIPHAGPQTSQQPPQRHQPVVNHTTPPEPIRPYRRSPEERSQQADSQLLTIAAIKKQLTARLASRPAMSVGGHLKSLVFGLACGTLFLGIFLFSFFNERIITPFIMPGKATASTRLIIDPNQSDAVGPENKIIIPKLNVEVPVVFDAASIEEKDIQKSLEGGVVHYPITENPGELGNGVIVGHSSNNILNKGKYKFAFLMLKKLEAGDTFFINYNSKRYVYKVYESKIVEPTDVSVLEDTDRPATMTLITCDPPGTSIKRLIVRGEQVSPTPSANVASTAPTSSEVPAIVPGNAPSLFQRFKDWLF